MREQTKLYQHWQQLRDNFILLTVERSKPLYARWFKKQTAPWTHSRAALAALPPGTLGQQLGQFLIEENIELMPRFESHDVMHVLLHYPTTVVAEVRMQFFLLGNGKRSLYALGTAIIGVLLIPEKLGLFFNDFSKGKNCLPCHRWDFQYLLKEPVALLRKQMAQDSTGVEAPFCV